MAPPMRLAFMGSPDFAMPALRALVAAGHEVAAVYTQPPRPSGRGQKETPCPVHRAALELGLPVRNPVRLRRDTAERGSKRDAAYQFDLGIQGFYVVQSPEEATQLFAH